MLGHFPGVELLSFATEGKDFFFFLKLLLLRVLFLWLFQAGLWAAGAPGHARVHLGDLSARPCPPTPCTSNFPTQQREPRPPQGRPGLTWALRLVFLPLTDARRRGQEQAGGGPRARAAAWAHLACALAPVACAPAAWAPRWLPSHHRPLPRVPDIYLSPGPSPPLSKPSQAPCQSLLLCSSLPMLSSSFPDSHLGP